MKFIAWGQKLHRGTHSYIHAAYCKAFERLGYESYHLDSSDDVSNSSFKDTIFLTIGTHDHGIPITNDAKYILHNCDKEKYQDIKPENKLVLQVYTNSDSLLAISEKIDDLSFFSADKKALWQPWATDLFPEEIDTEFKPTENKVAVWSGSVYGGEHGNINEIKMFVNALHKNGYKFVSKNPGSLSFEDNKKLVNSNELAPAINGTWQKEKQYIPCRIFKNISYGALGLTNNKTVNDLLQGEVFFSENESDLFYKYLQSSKDKRKDMFEKSCKLVKEKHTYINRAKIILDCL